MALDGKDGSPPSRSSPGRDSFRPIIDEVNKGEITLSATDFVHTTKLDSVSGRPPSARQVASVSDTVLRWTLPVRGVYACLDETDVVTFNVCLGKHFISILIAGYALREAPLSAKHGCAQKVGSPVLANQLVRINSGLLMSDLTPDLRWRLNSDQEVARFCRHAPSTIRDMKEIHVVVLFSSSVH